MKLNEINLRMECLILLAVVFSVHVSSAQITFSSPPLMPPTYQGNGGFVGDFNGDGKPDILAYDGNLNLGNGDGTFTPGTSIPGSFLAVADFNDDGNLDVLYQTSILFGNGDGTFQPPIPVTGITFTAGFALDLNGDGKADIIGFGYSANQSVLLVYLSKGDGTFTVLAPYALGSTINQFLGFGDFNGDQKIDVAVASSAGSSTQGFVLLGNGDGTFKQTAASLALPLYLGAAAVADFNNDGKLDIATLSGFSTIPSLSVQLGNGDGTFQSPAAPCAVGGSELSIATPEQIATADLNGDGKLDVVIGSTLTTVCLGNGDGTFLSPTTYYLPFSPSFIATADFNLDGKWDVMVGNEILLGNGDGTLQGQPALLLPYTEFYAGVVGQFTQNAAPGVALIGVSANFSTTLLILANNGGILSLAHSYPVTGNAIASADLNGDGKSDLILTGTDATSGNWNYTVLLGNGDGSFQPPVLYQQSVNYGGSTLVPIVSDFNRDGKTDIAVAVQDSVAVLLGKGDGTFDPPAYVADGGAGSIASADFNNDGKLDIAAAVPGVSTGLAILLGNGDGTFQPMTMLGTSMSSPLLAADVNVDGKTDVVGALITVNYGFGSGQNEVLLGNGNATFTVLASFPSTNGLYYFSSPAGLVDLNGDGIPDLISFDEFLPQDNDGTGWSYGIYLGEGNGNFETSEIPVPNASSNVYSSQGQPQIQIGDMNGDGKPDLVVENQSAAFVLLNTTVMSPNFFLSASPFNNGVIQGGSATSLVTIVPTDGFGGSVSLSCSELPTDGTCSFNPPFVAGGSGTSTLTFSASSSMQIGGYSFGVTGTSGSLTQTAPVTLYVEPPTSFTLGAASGSGTSATVNAGSSATFNLAITPGNGWTGTVDLACAIAPVKASGPVCTVTSNTFIGVAPTVVPIKVSTTAATGGMISDWSSPIATPTALWILALAASSLLLSSYWRRLAALAPMVALALLALTSCGGGSSSTPPTNPGGGTPAGTYTATVTATSGSVSHNVVLTITVQ